MSLASGDGEEGNQISQASQPVEIIVTQTVLRIEPLSLYQVYGVVLLGFVNLMSVVTIQRNIKVINSSWH